MNSSLNSKVDPEELFDTLGCNRKHSATPTTTKCPVCRTKQVLQVYHDRRLGGERVLCRNCRFSGDLIQLAAKTWGSEIPRAIERLGLEGIIDIDAADRDTIQKYIDRYWQPSKRISEFWDTARRESDRPDSERARDLLKFLQVAPMNNWVDRAGRILGYTERSDLQTVIWPCFDKADESGRIFKGGFWKELLVIPFYDVPDRICGFLCCGAVGKKNDFVTRYVPLWQQQSDLREAGLGMLDSIETPHKQFADKVFCISSFDIALSLQVRKLRDSAQMLPIVVPWDGDGVTTRHAWDFVNNSKIICWDRDPMIAVKYAKVVDGYVSSTKLSKNDDTNRMVSRPPISWLRRFEEDAMYWCDHVRNELEGRDYESSVSVLEQLELNKREFDNLLQSCGPGMQERLKDIRSSTHMLRKVAVGQGIVSVRRNKWYLNDGRLLSDATLRIDRTITTPQGAYYEGAVRYKQHEFPFTELADTLDEQGFNWIKKFLRDTCQAGILRYEPQWERRAVRIAMEFHEPTIEQAIASIGWQRNTRSFDFPTFRIESDGAIRREVEFCQGLFPAVHCLPPDGLTREEISVLSHEGTKEAQAVWATLISVIYNLVAPAIRQEPQGILLVGSGAYTIGTQTAKLAGCPKIEERGATEIGKRVAVYAEQHDWPVILKPPYDVHKNGPLDAIRGDMDWTDEPWASNVVYAPAPETGYMLALRDNWTVIRCTQTLGSPRNCKDAIISVIPNYLQSLLRRRFDFHRPEHTLFNALAYDIRKWFGTIGGNELVIRDAARFMVSGPGSPRDLFFGELVQLLIGRGKLTYKLNTDRPNKQGDIFERVFKEDVWIPQERFREIFEKRSILCPDITLVTGTLREAGALLAEENRNGKQGWLVHKKWWNHCAIGVR